MGSALSNLVANILAYNLISELSRNMGRKFAAVSGDFPGLGNVITVACNNSAGTEPVLTAWLKMVHKYGASMGEKAWKYS